MKGIKLFIKREAPIDLSVFDEIEKNLHCTLPYEYKLFMSEYLPEPQLDEILLFIILLPCKINDTDFAPFYGLETLNYISYYDRFSYEEPVNNFICIGMSIPNGGFYLKLEGEDKGGIYFFDFGVLDSEQESVKIADNFTEFLESIEFEHN